MPGRLGDGVAGIGVMHRTHLMMPMRGMLRPGIIVPMCGGSDRRLVQEAGRGVA
jgi:hypothetical protein